MKTTLIFLLASSLVGLSVHAYETTEQTVNLRFVSVFGGQEQTVNGVTRKKLHKVGLTSRHFINQIGAANGWSFSRKARIIRVQDYFENGNTRQIQYVIRDSNRADINISNWMTFTDRRKYSGIRFSPPNGTGPFDEYLKQSVVLRSNTQSAYRIDLEGVIRFKGRVIFYNGHRIPIYNQQGPHTGEDFFANTRFSILSGRITTSASRIVKWVRL